MISGRTSRLIVANGLLGLPFALPLRAQSPAAPTEDLTRLSLEQLSNAHISVTSFGRKDEDLWKTPAAVFVIPRDEIVRSAAQTIPDLLRMVPGVQVAQLNASTWAVSARGFNSVLSNKLLVLVDGRTFYTETFPGAQWDLIDLPLDNIERIEIIRGPGAAVWGANAVNGVINIITRHARAIQGWRLGGQVSRVQDSALIRYGGTLGDRVQYAAYASYRNRLPFDISSGARAFDGEDTLRGGFLADWRKTQVHSFTLEGDLYAGHQKQVILPSIANAEAIVPDDNESLSGGHLLGRWRRHTAESDLELQTFFDSQSRRQSSAYTHARTLSADLQDHLRPTPHHDIVWGAELRLTYDTFASTVVTGPQSSYRNYLVDAFLQDEIALIQRRLILTLGSKIQQGTLAGFQLQPSIRLLYAPRERLSLWAAVSRAVVTPSLQDTRLILPIQLSPYDGVPASGALTGNLAYRPEEVLAYELGFRARLTHSLTVDVASFYNTNRRLQSLTVGSPALIAAPNPYYFIPLLYANSFQARSDGVEASLVFKPSYRLSFQTAYAWMDSHTTQLTAQPALLVDEWNTPHNSISEFAIWNVTPLWAVSGFLAHVNRLAPPSGVFVTPAANGAVAFTPAYTRLDLRVSRKLPHGFRVDAAATNLLTPRHLEFGSNTSFDVAAYVPRSAFLKASWTF